MLISVSLVPDDVRGLKEDDRALNTVQKLLISTTAEQDYSAQETCHLLLMLPMYMASCDFEMLIRESVDSLCRDGANAQYMQYLSKNRLTSPQIR